jgi:outer membrane protein OmpA-like peptidoglycan-associated protein
MAKSNRALIFLVLGLSCLLSACAGRSQSRVVLLPDPDGKTGVATVTNKGGTETLSGTGKATEIRSIDKAPKSPVTMPESEIRKVFGEALDAQPPVPAHYLLYFLSSTTELAPESRATREELFAALKRIKPVEVSIVGHTDRVGSREDNYRLGLERARIIKGIVMQEGVAEALIETVSHGEDNPLIKTDDEIPEPRNRYVEVVIR